MVIPGSLVNGIPAHSSGAGAGRANGGGPPTGRRVAWSANFRERKGLLHSEWGLSYPPSPRCSLQRPSPALGSIPDGRRAVDFSAHV